MSENCVHLLLCTNALYLPHAAACLVSLLQNNPDLDFDIVVVRRETETLDEEKLRRSLKQFANHLLYFCDFATPGDLPLNPHAHYTLDNWTRIWVEKFFRAEIERVLYFDCDVIVNGSIASLWQTDLDGALLGAIDIPGSVRGVTALGMRAEDGYFNSGVLLIDLKQWRETGALAELLTYVDANSERLEDLDQDALNACFHSRRKRLDYKWNVTWSFFQDDLSVPLDPMQIEAVRREAIIVHFNGWSKPWSYRCEHPHKADYQRYLKLTEWRGFIPQDRSVVNIARKVVSAVLPEKTKQGLKALVHSSEARPPEGDRSARRKAAKGQPISSRIAGSSLPDRLRRAVDLVIACTLVVLTLPLIAFVCLAIKLDDDGPVFDRQPSLDRTGRPFVALKFRTTVRDPEWTASRPKRDRSASETTVGQFLRWTSIEDLPQLVNVLRGEMTLTCKASNLAKWAACAAAAGGSGALFQAAGSALGLLD
jgi:lipopolysaccharide biosynthesis glycosyltransferase